MQSGAPCILYSYYRLAVEVRTPMQLRKKQECATMLLSLIYIVRLLYASQIR